MRILEITACSSEFGYGLSKRRQSTAQTTYNGRMKMTQIILKCAHSRMLAIVSVILDIGHFTPHCALRDSEFTIAFT
jgi:hypothetical protein